MKIFLKIILFLSFAAVLATVTFAEGRVLQKTTYAGDYKGINVEMTRLLKHLGGQRYLLSADVKNFFAKISESEEFLWSADGGIIPQRYRYEQNIFRINRKHAIDFDWTKARAQSTDKGKKTLIALTPGVLGPMSYQLQLRLDLMAGRALSEYRFINRGKLKFYSFALIGMVAIDENNADLGTALRVERLSKKKGRSTSLWFDPHQAHTVVLLAQEDKGDEYALRIKENHLYPPFENTVLEVLR